jgi:hypothetical protein
LTRNLQKVFGDSTIEPGQRAGADEIMQHAIAADAGDRGTRDDP